jgi:hypothetical protein
MGRATQGSATSPCTYALPPSPRRRNVGAPRRRRVRSEAIRQRADEWRIGFLRPRDFDPQRHKALHACPLHGGRGRPPTLPSTFSEAAARSIIGTHRQSNRITLCLTPFVRCRPGPIRWVKPSGSSRCVRRWNRPQHHAGANRLARNPNERGRGRVSRSSSPSGAGADEPRWCGRLPRPSGARRNAESGLSTHGPSCTITGRVRLRTRRRTPSGSRRAGAARVARRHWAHRRTPRRP